MNAALTRFLTEMGPRWSQDVVGNGDRVFDVDEPKHQAWHTQVPTHQPPLTIAYGAD